MCVCVSEGGSGGLVFFSALCLFVVFLGCSNVFSVFFFVVLVVVFCRFFFNIYIYTGSYL